MSYTWAMPTMAMRDRSLLRGEYAHQSQVFEDEKKGLAKARHAPSRVFDLVDEWQKWHWDGALAWQQHSIASTAAWTP